MKIIKPGREQKGWSREATCTGRGNGNGGCGATLLVEQADVYKTFRHCRDETDVFYTFTCACCGVETDFGDGVHIPFSAPDKETWKRSKETWRRERARDDAGRD